MKRLSESCRRTYTHSRNLAKSLHTTPGTPFRSRTQPAVQFAGKTQQFVSQKHKDWPGSLGDTQLRVGLQTFGQQPADEQPVPLFYQKIGTHFSLRLFRHLPWSHYCVGHW